MEIDMFSVHYACKWRAGVMTISRKKNWKKNVENLKIHGDVLEETGCSEDCRDESVVNNHSFVVGDEGKIIHVESI